MIQRICLFYSQMHKISFYCSNQSPVVLSNQVFSDEVLRSTKQQFMMTSSTFTLPKAGMWPVNQGVKYFREECALRCNLFSSEPQLLESQFFFLFHVYLGAVQLSSIRFVVRCMHLASCPSYFVPIQVPPVFPTHAIFVESSLNYSKCRRF